MRNKILGNKGLTGVMEFFLRGIFLLGIVVTATLPFTLRPALEHFRVTLNTQADYWYAFAFIAIFGVFMVAFIYFAARIFHTINEEDPFIWENVQSLGRMSYISLILCVDCWIYSLVGHSILAVLLGFVFLFLCGLFLVLRELFHSAVLFKQENDYTI